MNGCVREVPTTRRSAGTNRNESQHGKNSVSLQGQLLDEKSLRAVTGKTADGNEIAKDCIALMGPIRTAMWLLAVHQSVHQSAKFWKSV